MAILLLAQPEIAMEQVASSSAEHPVLEQLSSREESTVEVAETNNSDEAADSVLQVSDGDTALELDRVEGLDRCSAELLSEQDQEFCARRLETRSADFTPERRKLSAEEVLFAENSIRRSAGDVASASKNVTGKTASAGDSDLQALASLTLAAPDSGDTAATADSGANELPVETQSMIEAIVNQLTTLPEG
ncbi:MAG TPA: hypothetical protein EYG46_16105 [Myxococcales bacterium]|nr:hypothetical protein [Myxococcales bacterium]